MADGALPVRDPASARRTASPTGRHWRLSLGLMTVSGFAGLGYQIVWTRQAALWLGHESAAVLAVVAAFFGGLAVGSLATGSRIERSLHPARWYAACEAVIGAWGALLIVVLPALSGWLLELTGPQPDPVRQWAVAFVGTFVVLLPATAAMGATLPAVERLNAGLRAAGRSVAATYAANTAGAVLGVLAAAFWLVPRLGLAGTTWVCIAANAICAAVAWTALGRDPAASGPPIAVAGANAGADRSAPRADALRLFATGFLGIGFEVLMVRVLSEVTEDTVYSFALLLATYLVGTALGAAAWSRRGAGLDPRRDRDRLLLALAAACLLAVACLHGLEPLKAAMVGDGPGTMAGALGVEAALALLVFALPSFVMGALFSHLGAQALADGIPFGRALGVNTLGAAVAPLFFGLLAVEGLGLRNALLLVAVAYLALASRRAWTRPLAWLPAGAALLLAFAPPLRFVDVPDGGRIVAYDEGVLGTVSVVEDADHVSRLRIDNREQEGSSATLLVDGRQALLPLLLHPAPRHALFLGLGTGVTASVAATEPSLDVDAVELLPEVIAASRHFVDGAVPRLRLIAGDARRYVRVADRRYDVVVSDNFHPARSGSGALYTVEHFEAVRRRLAPGGVFCQWLPLHQLDLDTLKSIVAAFVVAYPHGTALLASNSLETPVIGLIGREADDRFDLSVLTPRADDASHDAFGLDDRYALFGAFVAGPHALRAFAGDTTPNTDDRPIVAYRAPRLAYAPDSSARDRLIALLRAVSIAPDDVIADAAPSDSARLVAYWRARDLFIVAGRDVRPVADAAAMLAQIGRPLLEVVAVSPDFRPAYDPLLRMAVALGRTDARGARVVLAELARLQPDRPEATRAAAALAPD